MNKAIINVQYDYIKGYHLFTSLDIEGLFVGSSDIDKAFDDLPEVITMLLNSNYGFDCKVTPLHTLEEYRDIEFTESGTSFENNSNRSFLIRDKN